MGITLGIKLSEKARPQGATGRQVGCVCAMFADTYGFISCPSGGGLKMAIAGRPLAELC